MPKFPQELDTDKELYAVKDEVDDIMAAHHNALKDAIKAIEAKIGIDGSAIVNTIDYILKNMVVSSNPPTGCKKVKNIYFDPTKGISGKYAIEREE